MRTGVTNILGMLALEKLEPIFEREIAKLRQEGHGGKYLIGISELKVKVNDNEILIDKSWKDIGFTIYDDRQFYENILESQTGNEIIMGEQI